MFSELNCVQVFGTSVKICFQFSPLSLCLSMFSSIARSQPLWSCFTTDMHQLYKFTLFLCQKSLSLTFIGFVLYRAQHWLLGVMKVFSFVWAYVAPSNRLTMLFVYRCYYVECRYIRKSINHTHRYHMYAIKKSYY